jgi:hypothetical protein
MLPKAKISHENCHDQDNDKRQQKEFKYDFFLHIIFRAVGAVAAYYFKAILKVCGNSD